MRLIEKKFAIFLHRTGNVKILYGIGFSKPKETVSKQKPPLCSFSNCLAEFAGFPRTNSDSIFRRHARRKISLRRSVTRALASTNRGKAPGDGMRVCQRRAASRLSFEFFYQFLLNSLSFNPSFFCSAQRMDHSLLNSSRSRPWKSCTQRVSLARFSSSGFFGVSSIQRM